MSKSQTKRLVTTDVDDTRLAVKLVVVVVLVRHFVQFHAAADVTGIGRLAPEYLDIE